MLALGESFTEKQCEQMIECLSNKSIKNNIDGKGNSEGNFLDFQDFYEKIKDLINKDFLD
jgi:hypothetical protein